MWVYPKQISTDFKSAAENKDRRFQTYCNIKYNGNQWNPLHKPFPRSF